MRGTAAAGGPPGAAAATGARRRRRRRLLLLGLAAAAALWLSAAVLAALAALGDVKAARADLERARAEAVDASALADGRALALIAEGRSRLARASARLRSPMFAPVRALPVIGRQVRSAAALSTAARDITDVAVDSLTQAQRLLAGERADGTGRAEVIGTLGSIAGQAHQRLGRVELGPRRALFPPLARAYNELAGDLNALRHALGRAQVGAQAVADLLRGPSRYLLFAANNAEMRAGSGMFLSVGELTFDGGRIALSGMRSVTEVTVPPGAVPLTGDYASRWGWLEPNVEWRNLMVSPRFEVNGPLAVQMWRAAGGGPVDGAMAVGPVALAELVRAVGPVEVDGRTLEAGGVVEELLHDQYRRFSPDDVVGRRDDLDRVAEAVFAAVALDRAPVSRLLDGLADAARGRHLLVYSERDDLQEAWRQLGVDGSLYEDSLLLSLLNRGGNKLDPHVRLSASVDVRRSGGVSEVTVEVAMENTVPEGEHPYIAGPVAAAGAGEGEYVGVLAVQLPSEARNGRIGGADSLVVAGRDGPNRVIGATVELSRHERKVFKVGFTLPGESGSIRVEPSARVPPSRWAYDGHEWTDNRARNVTW